jgi:hypothetical protein
MTSRFARRRAGDAVRVVSGDGRVGVPFVRLSTPGETGRRVKMGCSLIPLPPNRRAIARQRLTDMARAVLMGGVVRCNSEDIARRAVDIASAVLAEIDRRTEQAGE